MQLAFSDGSHIVDNPAQYFAAHRRLGVHGLGDAGSIAAISAQGASTAASLLGGISAATTAAGSGFLAGATVFGMAASAALPLIGAAIAGLTAVGFAIAKQFEGCGQTCIEATSIANQVGTLIDQAYNYYMNSPVHYASMQKAYLAIFDSTWAALVKACSDPSLQAAGQRCISDRQAGSCAYHTSPYGWQQTATGWTWVEAGPNGSGTMCWNSFSGRRDPVANDPTVVPDPVGAITDPTTGAVTGIQAPPPSIFGGASMGPVVLIGGGILAAVLLLGND